MCRLLTFGFEKIRGQENYPMACYGIQARWAVALQIISAAKSTTSLVELQAEH
jgi:hypothetical protein